MIGDPEPLAAGTDQVLTLLRIRVPKALAERQQMRRLADVRDGVIFELRIGTPEAFQQADQSAKNPSQSGPAEAKDDD